MQKEKLFSCIIFVLASTVLIWGSILIRNVVTDKNIREAERIKLEKEKDAERLRAEKEKKLPRVFKMGRNGVRIGNLTYAVYRAIWDDYLSESVYGDSVFPDAYFLVIDVVVRNDDKSPRTIPPFYLIDEIGREYETSSKVWSIKGRISLDRLNPGMKKYGKVIFDVPRNHSYNLKVSDGLLGARSALFKITADRY